MGEPGLERQEPPHLDHAPEYEEKRHGGRTDYEQPPAHGVRHRSRKLLHSSVPEKGKRS